MINNNCPCKRKNAKGTVIAKPAVHIIRIKSTRPIASGKNPKN